MKYLISCLFAAILIAYGCTSTDKTSNVEQQLQDSVNHAALKDTATYTTIEWLDSTSQVLKDDIKGGQKIEISWKFRNTGKFPLIIADVRPGCGCTTGYRPEKPVDPGKEDVIKAIYQSSEDVKGVQKKTVTVRSNTKNSNSGETVLDFSVNVKPGS